MRLQIKKLDGPNQIRLNISANTIYTGVISTNDADDKYTCYFNRSINDEDTFPISITVTVYDDEGNLQQTLTMPVAEGDVNDRDSNANFCFTLTLNCPQRLSGSYFHVHAVLINADVNAHNISYGVSSYHQTIKKVFIYADKSFEQVYWSNNLRGRDSYTRISPNW